MTLGYTINSNAGAPITGDTEAFTLAQLGLYNGACRMIGNARLSALTDNVEARYLLDDVWNDGAVQMCLESGLWFFARRTSQLGYDATITPQFGYQCAFQKPGDWVRTMGIWSDDRLTMPLTRVSDEAGTLYADMQTIWVAYVSNDPGYGGNLGLWPQSFSNAVQGYLASQIVSKVTGGSEAKIAAVRKEADRLMSVARSRAAMNDSAKFPPIGTWARSRRGNSPGWDGGVTTQLIG